LGIVLYEMATGQLPFNADDIGALLLQQVKQAPAPPRLINSDLSMTLEGVILKALEKNPVRRYQSAGAMATALADAVPGAVTIDTDTQMKRPPGLERLTETAQKETAPARKRLLRIILADDHTLLRRSLASMLEVREDFVVVAEASDAESAFQQTVSILPDVLILDLNMPGRGGLDVLPDIRRDAPDVKVLVLTGREEEAYIVRALKAGAHGYMLKSSDESELVDAITKVARGELALGSGVTEKMVGGIVAPESSNLNKLSEQDQKILLHVAAGMDNEAIAQRMNISLIDVIEALADLMNRLNAKDRYAVALLALREGYILLDDLQDLNASL
jgi:DNA-binding NarL/FixJ family response regulator